MSVPLILSEVPNSTPYVQYVATNSQTIFPYPFPITQDSDLIVVVNGVTLATDSGYSLSGQGNDTGGFLTFSLGRTAGDVVTLFRDIAIERISQIAQNSGFSSTVFNAEFNQIYLLLQQLESSIGQCLQIPNTNNPAPLTQLLPSTYASKYLAFDAFGNPTPAVLSTTAMTQAIIAALLNPQSTPEFTAGVVPSSYLYLPGDIRRYGAKIDGASDDTAAWTTAIALAGGAGAHSQESTVKAAAGISMVSQITFNSAGIKYQGNGCVIRGNAIVATPSVVDIIAGSSVFYDLNVDGNVNSLYQCGVHWYTYNLNLYDPGFVRIVNLQIQSCLIGLCVGALPTQSLPIPNQGVVTTAPNATDAPLSESSIVNISLDACVNGVYMSQPNGKITILGGAITGDDSGWAGHFGASGYTAASTCAIIIKNASTQSSSLILHGVDTVQNIETTGTYLQVTYGELHLLGCTVETQATSYLAGTAILEFVNCQDMGWNDLGTYVPIQVDHLAKGQLVVRGGTISFANGLYNQNVGPFAKSVASLGGALSPNYGFFRVLFDGVDLKDVPLLSVSSYLPFAQGLDCTIRDCRQSDWTVGTQNFNTPLNEEADVLAISGAVDTSAATVTAYGANGNGTSGGWTFAVTSAGADQWGSSAISLVGNGPLPVKCIDLTSGGAGNTVTATSAKFTVVPGKTYLIKGYFKSSTAHGAACKIIMNNYKFGGGSSSVLAASTTALNLTDTSLGNTFQQLLVQYTAPLDTMQATIELSVTAQADLAVAGLLMK